jgi:TetR/AcrR family transcriptional regulator, transcriptional repressor for nem operon
MPAVSDSKSKSRQASKQETREALIAAGIGLFSEQGVDLPSLDAICARAGFTRGAFYVHFRNRDDFLVAVIEHVLVTFVDSMVTASESGNDLSDTIGRFLRAASLGQVPLMGQQRLMLNLVTRGVQRAEKMSERFRVLLDHALSRLADSAARGQASGAVKTQLPPELVATFLLAAALGVTTLLEFGVKLDVDRLQTGARELFGIEPA